jgi:hypothetical protein
VPLSPNGATEIICSDVRSRFRCEANRVQGDAGEKYYNGVTGAGNTEKF